MKIQHIKNWTLSAFIFAMLTVSCSKDLLDDINSNPNNPKDVPSQYTLTDVITSSAFNVIGSDLAFYASVYMEHNVGVYNQMYNAERRLADVSSASTYDNGWNAAYTNLWQLKTVIEKCSDGGAEEGNYPTLGVAQVLSAINLATLTDLMGDVPWTESGQAGVIFQPKIDKQEAIYTDIFKFLDDAIANLAKERTFEELGLHGLADQDLLFHDDASLWTKLAYGLRARYKLRLSLKTAKYQEVIDDVNKSFDKASEQAAYKYDGSSGINPFTNFYYDRDYFGASTSLHNKLIARNDPRDDNFFIPYNGKGTLRFAPNGNPDQVQGYYGTSGIMDDTNPTYLLSYHEVQFIKAEASARLGKTSDAEAALIKGIKAAFVKVGLEESDAQIYYDDKVKALFTANPLKEIATQKYLSFYEDEAVEAYNDYRRYKAMGDPLIDLSNTGKFPLRFAYGNSDVTTNSNVASAYGDGQYVYSENVWWAGGTR